MGNRKGYGKGSKQKRAAVIGQKIVCTSPTP